MRKRVITLLAAVALVWISTHETAHAQEMSPSFTVGGGLGIPIDAEEGVNNGLAIRGGVSLPVYQVYQNLHAVFEGHYSKNSLEEDLIPGDLSGDVILTGANLGVMLRSSSSISVYGQGGIGLTRVEGKVSGSFMDVSISSSATETAFSFTVGGGVHIPINPSIGVAIDARYNHAVTDFEATKWMPITVSIVFSP